MIKSLRWRLQIWYTGLLLAVVGGFGGILYYQTYTNKFLEIDAQLIAGVVNLDTALRGFPAFELDGKDPPPWPKEKKGPRPGPPPDGNAKEPPRGKDKKGPPPPPSREKRLADLGLPRELAGPADVPDGERPYFAIWRGDGSVLKMQALPPEVTPPPAAEAIAARPHVGKRDAYREAWMLGPRDTRIVVGRSVAREVQALHAFAWQLAGIGLAVLVVGLAGGFALASRLFRPIAAMSAAASGISATNLSTRIDVAAVDVELAGLAQVLNAMLGRIEAAFQRQQQFTADASHELRTPLAILRANAELALSQSRSAEEYRQTIEACLRAADRMSALVQGLLTLARADAGDPGMQLQPVLLEHLIADGLTALKPLAEAKKITLTAELMPAEVLGDPNSLTQLVNNLLGNAIQHNHAAGTAHVRLATAAGDAVLAVSNTGPGIPEADRRRLFERFFRVDKARTRVSGGTGLGLAICKAIVEAHHGAIDVEKSDGDETVFRVTLPLVKALSNK
jgi:two-component system, OmpR family, sensor kinase